MVFLKENEFIPFSPVIQLKMNLHYHSTYSLLLLNCCGSNLGRLMHLETLKCVIFCILMQCFVCANFSQISLLNYMYIQFLRFYFSLFLFALMRVSTAITFQISKFIYLLLKEQKALFKNKSI
jgi:hypothetical protein